MIVRCEFHLRRQRCADHLYTPHLSRLDKLRVNSYHAATTFAPNSGETMSVRPINISSSTRLTNSHAGKRSVTQLRKPSPDDTFISVCVARDARAVFFRDAVVRRVDFLCSFICTSFFVSLRGLGLTRMTLLRLRNRHSERSEAESKKPVAPLRMLLA